MSLDTNKKAALEQSVAALAQSLLTKSATYPLDFIATAGQTTFSAPGQQNYHALVFAQGLCLPNESLDLTVGDQVTLVTPRNAGDFIKIVFFPKAPT